MWKYFLSSQPHSLHLQRLHRISCCALGQDFSPTVNAPNANAINPETLKPQNGKDRDLSGLPLPCRAAGLSGSDHKYLGVILQHNTLTAGDIAKLTGLTTGAVTGLIDRLEKKSF